MEAEGFTRTLGGTLERWDRVPAPSYREWGYRTRILDPGNDRRYVECQFGLLNEAGDGWSPRLDEQGADDRMVAFRFHYTSGDDAAAITQRLLSDELSSWHMLTLPDKEAAADG